jgi:hypothetical protein
MAIEDDMNSIVSRSGFALAPTNMDQAMRMADMLCKSAMVPKAYQNKPQDTLVAMMMGHEVGLNPIQALQNIAVINGKPSIYGDALAALVQNHPAFGGMEESFNETTMTATCTVWRKGGTKHTQTFSQADASAAGLWGKAGPWTQYRKRMLQMRARGFALRSQFADALAGLITREEAEDMPMNDYEAPTAIEAQVIDISGDLKAINEAATMEVLRSVFATAWKANPGSAERDQLTKAKDLRKVALSTSNVIEGEVNAAAE